MGEDCSLELHERRRLNLSLKEAVLMRVNVKGFLLTGFAMCLLVGTQISSAADEDCETVKECVARVAAIATAMKDDFRGVFDSITRNELPVGTVVTSVLPPDKFLRLESAV